MIKLHGSVSWAREVDTPIENLQTLASAWAVPYVLIDRTPDLAISQRYVMPNQCPIGKSATCALSPAIAIPVETKRSFECPDDHLETLMGLIPSVTKLLMIGWRATEAHFLKLLAENLQGRVRVLAVADGQEGANEAIENLRRAGINGEFTPADGGFSEFVVNGWADAFLRG